MTKRQMFQSLQNLEYLIDLANSIDNTKYIVKKMASSWRMGGVHGVGPFYAQVIVNVATKIGLITNRIHVEQVSISTSTTTFKRLRQMGVKTTSHASELVPFLVHRTGEPAQKCENMICEMLRRKFGTDRTKDYFVRGHKLYVVRRSGVYMIDWSGRTRLMRYPPAMYNSKYRPEVCWWSGGINFGKGAHHWDHNIVHLKKRKVVS